MATLFENFVMVLKKIGEPEVSDNITTYDVSELSYIENSNGQDPVVYIPVMGLDVFLFENDVMYIQEIDPDSPGDENSEVVMAMFEMDDTDLIADVRKMMTMRLKMLAKWKF